MFTESIQSFGLGTVGVRINGEYLSNQRFADDIALQSNSGEELQSMVTDLDTESRMLGLKINMKKTKVMFNSLGREQRFAVGGEALEVVGGIYLLRGQVVTANLNRETEITRRIGFGWSVIIWQALSDHEWQLTSIPQEKSI